VLGGTYPLSGPVAAYAAVPVGIKAWFDHLNATEGGITAGDGVTREITWNYLDDQYSPPASLENVRRLVESDGSWLVLNPLGTPSNTAIRDYMNEAEVPQLYVATGAATWGRDIEEYPWTIGYQPDYESEGIAYAQYALEENPEATVAILYANDDFGKDYLTGIKEGMGDAADQIVAEVTYETTDATVDAQVAQALESDPDVFMLIATPQFAIQGINQTQALGYEGTKILTSVSSSVGAVIANVNDGAAEGWITSVYLKDPTDPAYDEDPGMVEYQEVLAEYAPDANPDDGLHLYGMSVAQLFQHTLESMPTVCRAAIMEAAKNLNWAEPPLLLEGISIETSEGDGFPVQQVQLQRWEGDGYVKFGDIIDASDINAD
jgi:branched-chain amino acid transport system substrate-binding protein